MDGEEFQQFVIEKLLNIENRITCLETKFKNIDRLTKIAYLILAGIAAKFGIDLTGWL